MPPKRNNTEPPKVMTRSKSMPAIALALVFDIARAFFTLFWFFGPALFGLYCNNKVGGLVGDLGGLTAAACATGAVVGGTLTSEFTIPLGVIMADAIGFLGFLVIVLWVIITDTRLVKAAKSAPLQFAGAFVFAEIPFIGALPVYTVVLWRLYGAQIRSEQEALNTWNTENAAALAQEQQMNAQIQIQQMQDAAEQELEVEEAANDEDMEEEAEETPNHTQLAA